MQVVLYGKRRHYRERRRIIDRADRRRREELSNRAIFRLLRGRGSARTTTRSRYPPINNVKHLIPRRDAAFTSHSLRGTFLTR